MNRMNRRVGGYSGCSKDVEFLTCKHQRSKAACTEMWGECKDGLKTVWKFVHRSFVSARLPCFALLVPSFLRSFPVLSPVRLKLLVTSCFPMLSLEASCVSSRRNIRFRFVFQMPSKLASLFHVFKQTSFLAHFSHFKRWNVFSILFVSYRLRLLRLLQLLVFSGFVRGVSCFLVLILNIICVSCLQRFPNQLPSVFKRPTSCFCTKPLTSHVSLILKSFYSLLSTPLFFFSLIL